MNDKNKDIQQIWYYFLDRWRCIGSGRFQYLKEFCGGLATVFSSTTTVKSDFSLLIMRRILAGQPWRICLWKEYCIQNNLIWYKNLKKDKNKDSETVHNDYKIQHNVINFFLNFINFFIAFCETIYERRC